ncbi:MAG: hypothetical protein J0L97_07310 [Alphaproteobacteria bacterium]|nr:hypothetical protein [Alphaproteobacteria bacterium]
MLLRLLAEDSFLSGLLFAGGDFLVAQAMLLFGHSNWLLGISAIFATAGCMLTAGLGYGLRHVISKRISQTERFSKPERMAKTWGIPGLLLAWLPLGQIIVFFAGFLRMPWKHLLVWITLGQLGFHGWLWADASP